jgi:hypothetical protein
VTKGSVVRRIVQAMYAYEPLEALAEVRCTVSILVAASRTADDEDERERLLALDDVRRVRGALHLETRVRRFEGAGHDLMRYRPDDVAAEIGQLAGS